MPYPALIVLIMWHINHKRLCITTFSDTQTVVFLQQYTTYNTTLTILTYNLRYLRYSTLLFIYIYTYIYISVQHKKGGGDIEQIFKERASNSKKTKKINYPYFPCRFTEKLALFYILKRRKGGQGMSGRKVSERERDPKLVKVTKEKKVQFISCIVLKKA